VEIHPEDERRRQTKNYAEMPLEQLQQIAGDWHQLTGIARETLEAEIQRRGSSVPDANKA